MHLSGRRQNPYRAMKRATSNTDWTFLLIVMISIALLVLAILYFWRPAAEGRFEPRWWQTVLMSVFFFGMVGLGYRRKRARSRAALHQALAETRAELAETRVNEAPSGSTADGTAKREGRRWRRGSGNTGGTVAE